MSEPPTPALPSNKWRDLGACLVCMFAGFVLATLPHWTNLAAKGTLTYLADGDDVLYLAIARIPYHGENKVRDPFARPTDGVPSLYSWMQFVPLSKVARWVGWPPLLIPLLWRIVGGVLLGGSIYLVFRRLFAGYRHAIALAIGCSLICLSDGGFIGGRIIVHDFKLVTELIRGIDRGKPDGLPQYRVVTPILNLPFLLIAVATLIPGAPRRVRNAVVGAIALGLCVHLYFFFWTAFVVAMCGYLGVLIVKAWRDRVSPSAWLEPKFASAVLLGGLVLGGSQIYSNAKTFADPSYAPILERMCRGRHLSPGHPIRTEYVVNTWAWGKIAIGAVAILGFGLNGYGLLWWLTFTGYALANHAILTGLEFENYHWNIVQAATGEIMMLGIACSLLDRYRNLLGSWSQVFWVVPVILFAIALIWRPAEALSAREPVSYTQLLRELDGLKPSLGRLTPVDVLAGPIEADVGLLLGDGGQLYQYPHTSHSSAIPDQDVHERFALNAWLTNRTREELVAESKQTAFENGYDDPTANSNKETVATKRLEIFDELERTGGSRLLKKYQPNWILMRSDGNLPRGRWVMDASTGPWTLWRSNGPDRANTSY